MKFRNYLPHDKELQEGKLAPPVLPKFEDPVGVDPPPSEKNEVINLQTLYCFDGYAFRILPDVLNAMKDAGSIC